MRVATEPESAVDEDPAPRRLEPVQRLFEEHGMMACRRCVGVMSAQIPRSDNMAKSSSPKGCSASRFSKRSRFHTTR